MAHTDNRQGQRHLVRGLLAGAAGGVAASFAMNRFHEGLGRLREKLPSEAIIPDIPALKVEKNSDPIVNYALGSAIGALYGVSLEYSATARTGLATFFASALFVGADARRLIQSGMRLLG